MLTPCLVFGLLLATPTEAAPIEWRPLGDGVWYALIKARSPAYVDAKDLHAVRIDPTRTRLRAVLASESDRQSRTAREWADAHGLVVATNLGMFHQDQLRHVGYLRRQSHVNSGVWVLKYQSALVFDPRSAGLPKACLIDLDAPGDRARLDGFGTALQNLRLIRGDGIGVWQPTLRRWSEAALAEDARGHLLVLFTRTPYSMKELNDLLLGLPLGIVRAQHLEGGPKASLSIHAGGLDLDLCGSFESGLFENESNQQQRPLPFVLGVERERAPSTAKPEDRK